MRQNHTLKLPSVLLEQLKSDTAADISKTKKNGKAMQSRKQLRKQERAEKKQRNAQFHTAPKRRAEEEHDDSPQPKKLRIDAPLSPSKNQKKVFRNKNSQKTTNVKKKTADAPTPAQTLPKSQKEIEEDNYITYLEAKLGPGKKERFNDGLDDLFDFASSLSFGQKPKSNVIPSKNSAGGSSEEESNGEEDYEDDWEEEGGEGEGEGEGTEDEELLSKDSDEWAGIAMSEKETTFTGTDGGKEKDSDYVPEQPAVSAGRYVPPHLRAAKINSRESEESIRLTKQLKGLLNRMSEQNMATILDGMEEIYRNHSRHDVTATITKLIIDGTTSHSSLLDSYVVLYATLVSALHKIVGLEFAAYVVQHIVSAYEAQLATLESELQTPPTEEPAGKEASNLIVLLSELYNFQVISSVLVFDIIRGLLHKSLDEFVIELLLKLLRNSGQQLRTDDPLALKDIVQIVQDKMSKQDSLSSRTRFMIETLTNLKNNKLKRNTSQNQGGEAVERMKKFLSGIGKKRHVLSHEPLRVSLDDLHSAGSKGKWWLVGAAWHGDPLVDNHQAKQRKATSQPPLNESKDSVLLQLAKKHGMNTDIRRSIFVILMSSDDYIDACDRISQLNLNEVQQREIPRVLLHCCRFEKEYNPYYSLIGQHLCSLSHAHKITLQYCLWDFLRDMGESTIGGHEVIKNLNQEIEPPTKKISNTRIRNVAKAYAWWIAKDALTLNVLKPVNFTTLKSTSIKFLRELFEQLFISSQASTPNLHKVTEASRNRSAVEQIFIQATHNPSLATGIIVFLSATFETPSPLIKWAIGIAQDTLRVGLDIVPNL